MATKASKSSRKKRRRGQGRNYLIIASDGTLLLASGSTGKVFALDPEASEHLLPLLKQRQKLGKQLAEMLQRKGFALSDEGIIDLEI
jgi:hypothetical protein